MNEVIQDLRQRNYKIITNKNVETKIMKEKIKVYQQTYL